MSNQKQQQRRPQSQQPQQYYAHGYTPDMSSYNQYSTASWQPAQQIPQQQQLYYPPPQQYPSTDTYAYANNAQFAPQHQHYQQTYSAPQQAYPTAYPAPNYLAPEYAGAAASPGHSPKPNAGGRARLPNFGFHSHSQGASPNLDAQLANLSIATSAHGQSEASKSDISLRYPALPLIPPRPSTPPALTQPEVEVEQYVSSLREIISAYERRDEILRLRTEAVGFQPRRAYLAWKHPDSPPPTAPDADAHVEAPTNPILGVRLLQRLDKLQSENDELGRLLSSGAHAGEEGKKEEVAELKREVEDCHKLIEAMDAALVAAEGRADRSERALEAACRTNSTAIIGAGKGDEEKEKEKEKKPPATKAGKGAATAGRNKGQNKGGGAAKTGSSKQTATGNAETNAKQQGRSR